MLKYILLLFVLHKASAWFYSLNSPHSVYSNFDHDPTSVTPSWSEERYSKAWENCLKRVLGTIIDGLESLVVKRQRQSLPVVMSLMFFLSSSKYPREQSCQARSALQTLYSLAYGSYHSGINDIKCDHNHMDLERDTLKFVAKLKPFLGPIATCQ